MKKRVLVVDDEVEILELAETFLRLKGFDVALQPSAEAGSDFLKKEKVDAIICDLSLPGMDGMDFYQSVMKANPQTPFVFISANTATRPEFEMAQRNKRPFKVFYKPFSFNIIAEYLIGALNELSS